MYFNDYNKIYEEALRLFSERNIGIGQGFSRLGDGFSEYYHNNAGETHFYIELTVDKETVRYDYLKKDTDSVIVFGMTKKDYQTHYSAPWIESEFPITQKLYYDFHEFLESDRVKYVELVLLQEDDCTEIVIIEVAGPCIDEEDMLEKAYLQAQHQFPADKFGGFGDVIDKDGTQFAYMI